MTVLMGNMHFQWKLLLNFGANFTIRTKKVQECSGLTCTDNASVLVMTTVVLTPAQVEALGQVVFCTNAVHVVQQDGPCTVAEEGQGLGFDSRTTSERSAHHVGVGHVPVVVTHRPPDGFVEDFHATLAAAVAVHHTHGRIGWRRTDRQV